MFESFYGLKEDPFSIRPDPTFLLLTRQYQRALAVLQYGLEARAGFTVVTGAIGSGKTTLIRRLFQIMDKRFTAGLVTNTQCESFEELLQWILLAFGLEYQGKSKVELYQVFTDFLVKESVGGRKVVLVIDEAQHLGPPTLEQLRMLSNVNADKEDLLQLILVGQPDLRELLLSPELFQFAQRIIVDFHLEPLGEKETAQYVRHRLQVAGGNSNLFSEEALTLIWEATNGVPRLINSLCGMALVYGFADQKKSVDAQLVGEVIADKSSSLSPIGNRKILEARDMHQSGDDPPRLHSVLDTLSHAEDAVAEVPGNFEVSDTAAPAHHLLGKLVVYENDQIVGEYLLHKQSMTIGRNHDNDICLDCNSVSAYHARILTVGNRSFIYDLKSTNGTWFKHKAIRRMKLNSGDMIKISKFRLNYTIVDELKDNNAIWRDTMKMSESDPQLALDPNESTLTHIDENAQSVARFGTEMLPIDNQPAPVGSGADHTPRDAQNRVAEKQDVRPASAENTGETGTQDRRETIKRRANEILREDKRGRYLHKGRLNARKIARELEPVVDLSVDGIYKHVRSLDKSRELEHPMVQDARDNMIGRDVS